MRRDDGTAYRNRKAAKQAMLDWKKKTGIKAILKKTANQREETRRCRKLRRARDMRNARMMSLGAASEVRIVKEGNYP